MIEGPGGFTDAFGDQVPNDSPTDIEECYDCRQYTRDQRMEAVARTVEDVIVPLERLGDGVEIVDACEEAWKVTRRESRQLLRDLGVAVPENDEMGEERRLPSALFGLMARDTSASFDLPVNSPEGRQEVRFLEDSSPLFSNGGT